MNTKSAIVVLALQEIADLVKKMSGQATTAFDLSGLGDLVGTALSPHSRNRRFGELLPKYNNKESAAQAVGQVVEGINACKLAVALSKKYKIKTPLARAIYNIVWKKNKADTELKKLLKNI
jgi:glycerol-3-phosphate dehydrogenase (NAD(P)+)